MTKMLEHVVLPYLVQKQKMSMNRTSAEFTVPPSHNLLSQTSNTTTYNQYEPHSSTDSSSSSNKSSSSSTSSSSPNIPLAESDLSRKPPPIIVYLDDDYPQTMALVNGVLNIFGDDFVTYETYTVKILESSNPQTSTLRRCTQDPRNETSESEVSFSRFQK